MSHRDDCPDRWVARREGERAFERGYGQNPYRDQLGEEGCPEAEREWRSGYRSAECREEERQEEQREQARMERRREEARAEEEQYWRECEQVPQEPFPQEPAECDCRDVHTNLDLSDETCGCPCHAPNLAG